jgi:AbiTii
MASLVEELQAEALNSSVPVDDLLRKAKVVAEKLDIRDFADWIERELTGYKKLDEYPGYRKVQGEFQAFNPYRGSWQPIIFDNPEQAKWAFEPRLLNSPVGELEGRSSDKYDVGFRLEPSFKAKIIKLVGSPTDVRCLLNRSQVLGIPSQVRNKILDWSLRLARAGVLGDGLSFSQPEKERAHNISINVHGNVENLSNVVDVGQGANVATD